MSKVTIAGDVNGTGVFTLAAPNGNTNRTLTLPDEAGTLVTTASLPNPLTSGTAVASTSGTAIDFTGIPSWVKRITVMFNGVSTNGSSALQVQLGTSGGIQTTGYNAASAVGITGNIFSMTASTTGFVEATGGAALTRRGSAVVSLLDASTGIWSMVYNIGTTEAQRVLLIYGTKLLSGTLDQIRLTTVNGTDTFDAGSINIMYE
jgi:hypothetical protein